jgi:hypothetical protein
MEPFNAAAGAVAFFMISDAPRPEPLRLVDL